MHKVDPKLIFEIEARPELVRFIQHLLAKARWEGAQDIHNTCISHKKADAECKLCEHIKVLKQHYMETIGEVE